jgi:hypothetical protein
MSANRKQSAVLRLLRGEDLELLSRELTVPAAELSAWRDAFLAAGETSLKTRPAAGRDAEIGRLKIKVGELTMTAELLASLVSCPRGMEWARHNDLTCVCRSTSTPAHCCRPQFS